MRRGPSNTALGLGPDASSQHTEEFLPPKGCSARTLLGVGSEVVAGSPVSVPVLIDRESLFHAVYRCVDATGQHEVSTQSGVDFTPRRIAVFGAVGQANAPHFERLVREGSKLIGVYGVHPYCGGPAPRPVGTLTALLVPAEPWAIDVRTFSYPASPCPAYLP